MIEVNSKIINPEELMTRVRKNILNKQEYNISDKVLIRDNVSLSEVNKEVEELYINIQKMNETWEIHDSVIRSHRKILGPFLVFGKRFIRKMIYWLIRPYIEQQVNFNAAATRAISDIARIQSQIKDSIENN